jgi:hypothetical protein
MAGAAALEQARIRRIAPNPIVMADAQERLRRRSQRRQHFIASAVVFEPNSETLLRARTADLGPEGCFIDTLNSFSAGTMVKLRIDKGNASFEAWAKVVYALQSMGMGLVFRPVAPEQLWVLHEWLGDTRGALVPEISLPPAAEDFPAAQSLLTGRKQDVHCDALSQLIMELMAHGLVSEEKGHAILQKLSRCPEE